MAAKFSRRKRAIITIVVACVVAVVLIPLIFINSYLTPKLSERLKSTVLKSSGGLYRINFSRADLHVLRGTATLYDVTLIPDTAIYHQLQRRRVAPAELYGLKVEKLLITGVHPFKLYFHKQLDIGQITLDEPQLSVSKYGNGPPDAVKKPDSTLYQKISRSLKFIHVGSINLNNIHLTYKDCTGLKPEVLTLKEMNLEATDLLIDSATQADKTRSLFCRDIITDLHHFKWATADGLYKFGVKSIHFSAHNSRLSIYGIEMKPIAATIFFANAKKTWDRYTLHLNSVVLNNFDFQSFRNNQELNIQHLIIEKGLFEVYDNPNGGPKKTDRIVTYPNWVLRNLKARLNVDTLDLSHIDVIYKVQNKKSMEAGAVLFGNTSGRFLHITNKPEMIKPHDKSTVILSTCLMGKGKMDLAFAFNLSGNYDYNYSGHLGPIDLPAGNSVVMPFGLAKFVSGDVKSLDFNIRSTKKTSTGKVSFLYNNMKVAMLRHDAQNGYTKKPLVSLVANLIVLKGNNPDDPGETARQAGVAYVRPPEVSFFGSIWATLFTGIKSCAGIGTAQQQAANAPTTEKEQKAQAKGMKKAERKAKKEEKQIKKQQQ
ncbi:MAG: hypothetical protein ACHQIM_15435 [Sphingobacteriales bacterium]